MEPVAHESARACDGGSAGGSQRHHPGDVAYTTIASSSITNRRTEPSAMLYTVAGTPVESHSIVPTGIAIGPNEMRMHLPLPSARGAVHGSMPATLSSPGSDRRLSPGPQATRTAEQALRGQARVQFQGQVLARRGNRCSRERRHGKVGRLAPLGRHRRGGAGRHERSRRGRGVGLEWVGATAGPSFSAPLPFTIAATPPVIAAIVRTETPTETASR